ncbi:MAG TPA: hypothetical protein PK625_08620 [Spirochaetales bacterium]|nr:hypothetical protein [Spirochaetales bacterium]
MNFERVYRVRYGRRHAFVAIIQNGQGRTGAGPAEQFGQRHVKGMVGLEEVAAVPAQRETGFQIKQDVGQAAQFYLHALGRAG